MVMMLLAADPGLDNGIAVLEGDGNCLMVSEIPTLGEGASKRLALARLNELIVQFHITQAIVEDVSAMPRQGVTSSFRFGRAAGQLEGALSALGVPTAFARPALWKRAYGVHKSKDSMRALAAQRWPHLQQKFERAKDANRAEAALLGLWYIERRR